MLRLDTKKYVRFMNEEVFARTSSSTDNVLLQPIFEQLSRQNDLIWSLIIAPSFNCSSSQLSHEAFARKLANQFAHFQAQESVGQFRDGEFAVFGELVNVYGLVR